MKAVVQRVIDASVTVNGELKGSIACGLLVYLGVARDDTPDDADWLAEKVVNLRIFDDIAGKMNRSLLEIINEEPRAGIDVNHSLSTVNNNDVNHNKNPVNDTHVNHQKDAVNIVSIGVLAVSQFTLLGDARKGRRPSWAKAAPPETARDLYHYFIEKIRAYAPCAGGEFQAHMRVRYTNDGPVTIIVESRE